MRKAFNFYQSHWEQIKLLNDSQRLDLFNSICSVQFLEVNIDDVSFKDTITTLVWTGIKHSINTSIKGFINKNKALDKEVIMPLAKGGSYTPIEDPYQQLEGEEEGEEEEEEKGQLVIPYAEIILHLNTRLNTKYSSSSKENKKLIKARFNQGFSLDDFKTVITKKCDEWINDKKMCAYLKPQTLFSNKFEGYLNQVVAKSNLSIRETVYNENEEF